MVVTTLLEKQHPYFPFSYSDRISEVKVLFFEANNTKNISHYGLLSVGTLQTYQQLSGSCRELLQASSIDTLPLKFSGI